MTLRRDTNGIPIVDVGELEELAERFLKHVAPHCLADPEFTPLRAIVERLEAERHLRFDATSDLGRTTGGHKILGSYTPARRLVAIDRSLVLDDDVRFSFTLAHELGHFYLHTKLAQGVIDATGVIQDSTRDIVAHRIESDNPRSLLEWQANRFAAGILVPRATLWKALEQVQRQLNIVKNLGIVWLDGTRDSNRLHRSTLGTLSTRYQTSRAMIRVRLEELGMVRRSQIGRAPKRLGQLLSEALGEVYSE